MEKLTHDDAYAYEVIINKINEIIDRLDTMEDDYDRRISAHWKFHRKEQEEKEKRLIKKPSPKLEKLEKAKEKLPITWGSTRIIHSDFCICPKPVYVEGSPIDESSVCKECGKAIKG